MKYLHCIFVALMVTTLAATAMEDNNTARLMGHWIGDPASAIEKMGLDANDPTVQMLNAMLGGIKATFSEDTVVLDINMMGKTDQVTTSYEVVEADGDVITIKNLDGPKMDTLSRITFTGDDTIEITEVDNPGQTTYLRRAGTADSASSDDIVQEAAEMEKKDELLETAVVAEEAADLLPRIMVILPEQIDTEWYWYYYTEVTQNIVQSAIEKALVRAGYDVIDVQALNLFGDQGDINRLWDRNYTVNKAREAQAAYVILGRATATKLSHDVAYGVNVFRSSAEITARLVRVSDGKILAVEDAGATAGGQAQKAAGQDALKDAAKTIARKLVQDVEKALNEQL
ncbi:MAG: hypothetical protein EOM20_15445 [Spartobacteria bacterium]|nr:hypothetical protein [Spartobacteria bacterium]